MYHYLVFWCNSSQVYLFFPWLVYCLIYIAGSLAGCFVHLFVNLLAVKFVYWIGGVLVEIATPTKSVAM
jgi:hypothetical protein